MYQKESILGYFAVIIHVIIRRKDQTYNISNTVDSSLPNKMTGHDQGSASKKTLWRSQGTDRIMGIDSLSVWTQMKTYITKVKK